jgi:conjugal transfer pilus assembly protein TraW
MIARILSVLAILVLFVASPSFAGTLKELGSTGTVYAIAEPDLLVELREYAQRHTPSHEKQQEERGHYQPKDMRKLPKAARDRTFDVDMTYTLAHDIKDGSGNVLYPRGYTINPLHYFNFIGGIVVIDGSDPGQVEWFQKSPYFSNQLALLLLSDGYAFELTEKFKRPVYYLTDIIAKRLQLSAVPSIVVKKHDALSVSEVKLEK